MEEEIRFDKSFDLAPGQAEEVAPGVRRLLANNPGPFTFKGTVSYIVGRGKVALIDPGPDDPAHIDALLKTVRDETVTHIFVTHTHRDHSPARPGSRQRPARRPMPKVRTAPRGRCISATPSGGKRSADRDFAPDVALKDGEVVAGQGWSIEAIATPGHTANHMAFGLRGTDLLFSGDHVMAWSTTVVAPPDGAMTDYMASLEKLSRRAEQTYLPGHGGIVKNAPRFTAQLIRHREGREASILQRLANGPADIPSLVRAIYTGIDPRLVGGAGLSVLAHLEDLVARGVVATDGPPSIAGTYRLAGAGLAA